jgi:hypothetical protein
LGLVGAQALNTRPIVGILTEPIDPEMAKWGAKSFIAASYVKYIEMAGARVVPVPCVFRLVFWCQVGKVLKAYFVL